MSLRPLPLSTALLLALACVPAPAFAHTPVPPANAQVAGVYHQRVGDLQVTALFDGVVALGRERVVEIDPAIVTRSLQGRFVPESADGLQTAVNAFLVRDGERVVLVDAGTGQCFGPGLGHVLQNLRAAGVDPADIDDVLVTHAHPDHLCGIADPQGRPAYPNATVWLSQADAVYWLDPASEARVPEAKRAGFVLARTAVAPYQAQGRLRSFQPGQPLPAGAQALDTHGHTPGHVSYRFQSKGQSLLIWGDVLHFHAVQFAHPEAAFDADVDRPAAIASRRAMLAEASKGQWWVAGAHLPFPGFGHVRREGQAYAWVPAEFSPL